MPLVNPEILRWARETAGYSLERAAEAVGLKKLKEVTAAERLMALEAGDRQPSRPLLLRMAQKYRRPLLAFYLDTPPRRGDRGEDFRSVPDRQTGSEMLVDALVRDVRARQGIVRDILSDDETYQARSFIGSAKMDDGVEVVLDSIRKTLRLDLKEYREQPSPEKAFALLRSRTEAAGIFVLLVGNLGSHHTAIDVEAFRGFALADNIAPFVIINDQDAVAAWSFTLLHELAHLWLGKTGVSGRSPTLQIEKFCNDVAAAFLLPAQELRTLKIARDESTQSILDKINEFSEARHLSRTMVAYSLHLAGMINAQTWQTISAWLLAQWKKSRDAKRDREKDSKPNYFVVRRHRLGPAILRLVARSMEEGALTPTRASRVLGVKPRSVAPLLSPVSTTGTRAA